MSHRYLILGLLMEHPMSGYDIRKHVQTALGAVANASYGTLYPTLHKLLGEGAVEVEEIPQQSRPAKKVYQITGEGRQVFLTWLKQSPSADDQTRREFLTKLYLAKYLSTDEVLRLLSVRRGHIEAAVQTLAADQGRAAEARQAWIISYALSMHKAELDWLEQIEHQIVEAS
ncbi:MAG: hypothetical protein CL610_02270 [Anaerolineaceae bacterium]|nr:hypothetical protein [Anaerolineaceae bacterium]